MTHLNMQNRTLGIMDNLPFLRSLNNECIDLIAIDPPFAANETFTGSPRPPITDAELEEEKALAEKHGVEHDEGRDTTVQDIWTWDANVHPDWLSQIEDDYPPVFSVIRAVESCATENEAAYIAFMSVRLIQCRRILKATGSIYLHCDDHANGYLRMLMDAVFGSENFRNEIVWRRYGAHNDVGQGSTRFGRVHDIILVYGKTDSVTWNQGFVPLDESYVKNTYRYIDEDTGRRFTTTPLLGPGGAEKGNPVYGWNGHVRAWRYSKETMQHLHDEGRLYYSRTGYPRRKLYLEESKGVPVQDLWSDISSLSGAHKERTGYATQKPLALYERIIEASSNPGDMVLDIFAGCATTAVAAERLGRQWIACDMAYRSWTMLKRRFRLNSIALSDRVGMRATDVALKDILGLASGSDIEWGKRAEVLGPDELPKRDDEDPEPFHNLKRLTPTKRGQQKSARSASWSGRIPKEEAKQLLVDQFGPYCWGCGWEAPKFPNGERDLGLLEVDHIWARNDRDTVSGGSDELYNLALLHATCNRRKSNRFTLEELRSQNADDQRIYGPLVHLGEATQFASEYILQSGPQPSLA